MLKLEKISYQLTGSENKATGGALILRDFSFEFAAGKIYAITGANGSGKSTLAKIIMGMIMPSSGRLKLDGVNLTALGVKERADLGICLSWQTPVVFKGLNVIDLLEIAAHKMLTREELCELFLRVGLCYEDYAGRALDKQLSGGELKRIEMATVLAREVEVNLFDEPEAGIDLWSFNQLTDIFAQMKTEGRTVIIITHQEKILQMADQILLLEGGQLKTVGNLTEVAELIPGLSCRMEGCPGCQSCRSGEEMRVARMDVATEAITDAEKGKRPRKKVA